MDAEMLNQQETKEAAVTMPKKLPAAKLRPAATLPCEVNGYSIEFEKRANWHKYRVDWFATYRDREKDLTRGPKNDYAKFNRMRVIESLYKTFFKKFPDDFLQDKAQMATDAANILISFTELPKREFMHELNVEDISSNTVKTYLGNKCSKVTMKVQLTEKVRMQLEGESEDIRATQQAFEIITSTDVIRNDDHFVFGNKFYSRTSKDDKSIDEGKTVKMGFEKNVRITADSAAGTHNHNAMLQIDAKASPFFQEKPLLDFALMVLNMRSGRDLESGVMEKSIIREKLKKQLKDLVVTTTHTKHKMAVTIHGIHSQLAKDTFFEMKDGEKMSVAEYFEKRHNLRLKCGLLVVEKRPRGKTFFPFEVLKIPRGQRVPNSKSTPKMTEGMIREAQMAPFKLKEELKNQLNIAKIRSSAVVANSGLVIGDKLVKVDGKLLEPPQIVYSNGQTVNVRAGEGGWKLDQRQTFLMPAKLSGDWLFIVFDRCCNKDSAKHFVDAFSRKAESHGMQLSSRCCYIEEWNEEPARVADYFNKAVGKGIKFFMFVTKQKLDDIHHTMKLLEARHGIPTQHLSLQTFNKALGDRGAFMVLDNLCLKTNLKLGGINHEIAVGPNLARSVKNIANTLLPENRMFIGLDVSHAAPQSFAERALNISQKEPSVVGMAFTLSMLTEMRGCYWLQEPRLQTVEQLGIYLHRALALYNKTNKRLPNDIVIFRSGMSEGEFKKVIVEMKEAMQYAFPLLSEANGKKDYAPTVSVIVVQLGSNYRLFTENPNPRAKAMEQNVPSGTTVDSKAVHPAYNEFVQVPQKAIQGTARPIRATLVMNDKGSTGKPLDMDEMELLTYYAAYGHQVVCSPTGRPAILYSAANLAKRGKNNWKEANYGGVGETSSMASFGSGNDNKNALPHDGSADFFITLSEKLDSKLSDKSHYWA